MKRVFVLSGAVVAAVVSVATIVAARYVPSIQENTKAGPIEIGGLTQEAAAKKLRVWWETEKRVERRVRLASGTDLGVWTPGKLGVTLDDAATVSAAPTVDMSEAARSIVSKAEIDVVEVPLVFKSNGASLEELYVLARKAIGPTAPARVVFVDKQVQLIPEVASVQIAKGQVVEAVIQGLTAKEDPIVLPSEEAPKVVSDDVLASITDVVGYFSTTFPSSNTSRCSNIRQATKKFSGRVLLPGEKISFNDFVGQRTVAKGYREAGVYVNGKHDVGIGGGICQVSTTLYNASLLANLKIRRRSNHSLPVAYVPTGQDATVDYGSHDLVIENNMETPVAIHAVYQPGRLTFRILGKKDPSLKVKIVREDHKSWDRGVKTVVDNTLNPGQTKVIEKGARAHSVITFREVYRDGALVNREPLGRSNYMGAVRVVAVGPSAE